MLTGSNKQPGDSSSVSVLFTSRCRGELKPNTLKIGSMLAEKCGAWFCFCSVSSQYWKQSCVCRNFTVFLLLQVGQDVISTRFCVPLSINRKNNCLVAAKNKIKNMHHERHAPQLIWSDSIPFSSLHF